MKPIRLQTVFAVLLLCALPALAAAQSKSDNPDKSAAKSQSDTGSTSTNGNDNNDADARMKQSQSSTTQGSVNVEGNGVDYTAVAGTLVLDGNGLDENTPETSMSYVAYFKRGADAAKRPITFLYNGGPGSSTVWLHMGAFGPRRIVTADDSHTAA
ncbi:MAG: hypothetical protein ACREP1_03810, partial [Rhodanobacteraceae bacterium]